MVNHACVAIGINRYQFLPPLNYGQADAQALWQFWVNQADLPASQCLLLTDTASMVENQSTYPTGETIWRWIESDYDTDWSAPNWRWFFFSGYGVSWEHVDYLLPIDANPKDIPGTGIPVRSLLESLKAQGGDNLLVFLDINRSPGLQAGAPVGAELVELAQELGVTLVLSSQLDQFSHEAAALGQGLFTAALLEALRYYHTDITLENLEQYLRDRLPELSQHHWRPIQTPLMMIPSDVDEQQLILPTAIPSSLQEQQEAEASLPFIPRATWEDTYAENTYNGTATDQPRRAVSVVETPGNASIIPSPTTPSNPRESMLMAMIPYANRPFETTPHKTHWLKPLLLWGGGAALVLALMIAAVLLRNRDAFSRKPIMETPTATTSPQAQSNTPSQLLGTSTPTSQQRRLQANKTTLDQAKRLIKPNQASLFNKAIIQARQVKLGDPLYQQAQQNIQRWSGVIIDIAEGRAAAGNLAAAIAAAQLMPKDDPSSYAKAQQSINQWKVLSLQWQNNKSIIQTAKQQIAANQASSYSRAITTVRQILPGQPAYAEAQQLITQWSRTIYLIAQSRAARGQFQEAIQTASLVPIGTPSSEAAQQAIAKWQQSKQ